MFISTFVIALLTILLIVKNICFRCTPRNDGLKKRLKNPETPRNPRGVPPRENTGHTQGKPGKTGPSLKGIPMDPHCYIPYGGLWYAVCDISMGSPQTHLGPGPLGPWPTWALAPLGPTWALSHLGPGPLGPTWAHGICIRIRFCSILFDLFVLFDFCRFPVFSIWLFRLARFVRNRF